MVITYRAQLVALLAVLLTTMGTLPATAQAYDNIED